jgi:hypothetical protein
MDKGIKREQIPTNAMKPLHQIVAAMTLLLVFGVSGADCLVPNAQMSATEKVAASRWQCDMSTAATHPCCQKIVHRQDEAVLNDLSHVATLEPGPSLDVSMASFAVSQRLGRSPHNLPPPSVEVLMV